MAAESAWRVVGGTAVGSSHLRQGLPCQDALAYRLLPGGVLLAAVADGAGTAERSEAGSRLAVDEALACLEAGLGSDPPEDEAGWAGLMHLAFETARMALLALAESEGRPERDFAATLTCAVATSDCLVTGTLGDCPVIAEDEAGLFIATQLQRGEYANETHFLTGEDALEQVQVLVFDQPVTRLALFSDGLARLALRLPSQDPHGPFFTPLFSFTEKIEDGPEAQTRASEQLEAFLNSERVCERTDDDKTLLLAVHMPVTIPVEAAEAGDEALPASEGQP